MNFSKSDEIFRMLDWDVGLFYNRTCTKDRMYFFKITWNPIKIYGGINYGTDQ